MSPSMEDLSTPCFLVDLAAVRRNCDRMLSRAAEAGVQLRGHVKTHKTVEAAVLQTGGSKRCLVTSTFAESEMLSAAGFDDILYGYPLIAAHMARNAELTAALAEYHVMVHSRESLDVLVNTPPPKNKKWSVFLAFECGNRREGIQWDSEEVIDVAKGIVDNAGTIIFKGIYSHCGNSYLGSDKEGVKKIRDETISRAESLRRRILAQIPDAPRDLVAGFGSTPSCSLDGFVASADIGEMHPGNYVFYDVQQWRV